MSEEQRYNLNFMVKLGKSPTESLEPLKQVYEESTMSRLRMFECHKRFKSGREVVKDKSRPVCVKAVMRSDCRLIVQMISDKCDFWFFPRLKSVIKEHILTQFMKLKEQ